MSQYQFYGVSASDLTLKAFTLPENTNSCKLQLRSLPGAKGIQLVLNQNSPEPSVVLRVNLSTRHQEHITVHLNGLSDGSTPDIEFPGREVNYLPLTDQYQSEAPKKLPGLKHDVDIVVLVDGSQQRYHDQGVSPLLSQADWPQCTKPVLSLLEWFEKHSQSLYSSVLAFGDHPLDIVKSNALQPRYLLYPLDADNRALKIMSTQQINQGLLSLPHTSGGDFVDALADALLMLGQLHWRDHARKLVILLGDSPGYSLLHPLPEGANAMIRGCDVETAMYQLSQKGIELISIYTGSEHFAEHTHQNLLQKAAKQQYQRLATYPELGFCQQTINPKRVLETLNEYSHQYLGVDCAYPKVESIEAID